MGIRKFMRQWREHRNGVARAKKQQAVGQVHLYNFWANSENEHIWLLDILNKENIIPIGATIGFWSVYGKESVIRSVHDDINIFYTGENIHWGHYVEFMDHMLSESAIDLAIGFDYFEHPRYMRLPYWILSAFGDCYTYEDVCKRCEELRYPSITNKNKWACAVASWDPSGLRTKIADAVNDLKSVDYPGKWRHNDDSLKNEFEDDKIAYLKQYVFNICPENSNSYGYVTEKLFEAIKAGCIPVYWGCYNDPEPGIINQDAVLFYDEKKGDELKDKIEHLINNKEYRTKFMAQPRLIPGAEDRVWALMLTYKERVESVIKRYNNE